MATNTEISRLFGVYAELLQLHEKDEKLAALLNSAAYRLSQSVHEVMEMKKQELEKSFPSSIAKIISTLKLTGTIASLDELLQITPAGLFEMMRIKGLGGKKLAVLWKKAKIDTVDHLLEAAENGTLNDLKGFGPKTQSNIIAAIKSYKEQKERFHYAFVADVADNLVAVLNEQFKRNVSSLCGEIRRQQLTVESIEIITTISPEKIKVAALRKAFIYHSFADNVTTGHTMDEIPVTIYHTSKTDFYEELFVRTGSAAHVNKIKRKLKGHKGFTSEDEIYSLSGLPYISPELREDLAEWQFIKHKNKLVETDDIRGVVHNHTTWSDGVDSLEDFVNACKKKGFEYCVISDHSKNAHYAGGLKEEKLRRQFKAIDMLNKKMKPFVIFKSIECDILVSGELDLDDEILRECDLVIVSIHQQLKMDEDRATKRLIKAIENPYTSILGHMTGRKLLIRQGYPVNVRKVIDACARNNVVIEINANPYRLDMDWSHIPYALDKGVLIAINPDAHSIGEIDNIRWGVSAARKGGLTTHRTWNSLDALAIKNWLEIRRKKHLQPVR